MGQRMCPVRVAMIGLLLAISTAACDGEEVTPRDMTAVVDSAGAGSDGGGACEEQGNRYLCFPSGTVCSNASVTGTRIYSANFSCPNAGVCCYFTE